MTIEEATREYARVSMPITENNKNGMGLAHGGAIFALADVAFGAAANCRPGQWRGQPQFDHRIPATRPGKPSQG